MQNECICTARLSSNLKFMSVRKTVTFESEFQHLHTPSEAYVLKPLFKQYWHAVHSSYRDLYTGIISAWNAHCTPTVYTCICYDGNTVQVIVLKYIVNVYINIGGCPVRGWSNLTN